MLTSTCSHLSGSIIRRPDTLIKGHHAFKISDKAFITNLNMVFAERGREITRDSNAPCVPLLLIIPSSITRIVGTMT